MAFLVNEANGNNTRYPIEGGVLRIGRSNECGVVLEHPQVSREHAQVSRAAGEFVIEDLRSRHGTFLNGRRLEEAATLSDGDVISVRGFALRFRLDDDEGPTAVGLPTVAVEDLGESDPVIMSTLDVISTEAMAEVRPEAKLRALLEISRSIQSTLSIEELLPQVLDSILRIFSQAEHGFVVLKEAASGEFVPKAWRSRGSAPSERVRLSRTVLRRAIDRREAILSRDTALDENLNSSESISDLGIRSILCAPLMGQTRQPLGVLQVHSGQRGRRFTASDLEVLVNVAGIMAMAIENVRLHDDEMEAARIRRETELAWDVQRRFLPARTPTVGGYGFFHSYQAARSVGGDYAGFIALPEGRLGIALGDVSGKGIPAAMLMARLSSEVRYALLMAADPGSALTLVNQSLAEAEIDDKFVSLVIMVLEPGTSRLTIANAGHPFPILCRADGGLEEIGQEAAGLPLNVSLDPAVQYENIEVSLERGSSVVIYSDGISEAREAGGTMFGLGRLLDVCRGAGTAIDLGERINDAVEGFVAGAPQHDDTSLICLGREI